MRVGASMDPKTSSDPWFPGGFTDVGILFPAVAGTPGRLMCGSSAHRTQKSDLVPVSVTLSSAGPVSPGQAVRVSWQMANRGAGGAPATVTTIRLGTSAATTTSGDRKLADVRVGAVGANTTTPLQSAQVTIPAGLPGVVSPAI